MGVRSWTVEKIFEASKREADKALRKLGTEHASLDKEIVQAEKAREFFQQFCRFYGWITFPLRTVELKPTVIKGVKAMVATPKKQNDAVVLYFHGGAFRIGLHSLHTTFASKIAQLTGARVIAVDYRLAPEHPFPAALEDVLAVYRSLLDEGQDPSKIAFMGDSAGGNLTLSLMLKLKEEGLPQPACAVPISPATDGTMQGESFASQDEADPVLSTTYVKFVWSVYLWDQAADNPLASPLYGDLKGLPPLLILVGGKEVLLDDSLKFAKKAKAAKVDVTLEKVDHMFHVYPLFYGVFPEGEAGVEKIAAFIKKRTKVER